jgi:hypothetical protein
MNENYLNQLSGNYFTSSGTTMNYPIWTSTWTTTVKFNKKEVSFIKKEIPKFNI